MLHTLLRWKTFRLLFLGFSTVLTGIGGHLVVAPNAEAVSNIELHGYVDAQYRWDGVDATTVGGIFDEGAMLLSHEFDGGIFLVDLPFTGGQVTGSTEFRFAKEFAQAYVGFNHGNGLRWKLGQWDDLYGLEGNDSYLIQWTSQGLLQTQVTPTTHAGFMLTYDVNEKTGISIYAGSPSGQGSLEGDKAEYGIAVHYQGETFRTQVGYRSHQAPAGRDWLADLILSLNLDAWTMQLQADIYETSTASSTSYAALLSFVYALNERWSLGSRGEFIHDGLSSDSQQIQVIAGPHFKINRDIKIKADYTFAREENGGVVNNIHRGAVAAVYAF